MTDLVFRTAAELRRRLPASEVPVSARLTSALLPVLPDRLEVLLSGRRAVEVDGNRLDPALQLFLTLLRVKRVRGMMVDPGGVPDVAASRRLMRQTCLGLGGPPAQVQVDRLVAPGPAGSLGIRRYRTRRTQNGPVPALVYFHGGGFVLGDLDSYDALCRRICRDAHLDVFSVDYRLAPEHPAPAAVDDCCAAYAWIAGHAAELGVCADRIAVGGDSAGGALAAALTQWARERADELELPQPSLQLLVYPVTDMTAQTRSRTLFDAGHVLTGRDIGIFRRLYTDGSGLEPTDPRISPLLADELSGLPPAIVITAGFDPLRDEGNQYAVALQQAGVSAELRSMGSMIHGFINFAGLGGGVERSVDEVISALRTHTRV